MSRHSSKLRTSRRNMAKCYKFIISRLRTINSLSSLGNWKGRVWGGYGIAADRSELIKFGGEYGEEVRGAPVREEIYDNLWKTIATQ